MDGITDLTCKDGTRQHPVDSGEATHNLPGDRVVPMGATRGSGAVGQGCEAMAPQSPAAG
jgi:hypothetical protein